MPWAEGRFQRRRGDIDGPNQHLADLALEFDAART
jgi:hypothetical protein